MATVQDRHHKAAAQAIGPTPGARWAFSREECVAQALADQEEAIAAEAEQRARARRPHVHDFRDFANDLRSGAWAGF